jgi:hypothetical protein
VPQPEAAGAFSYDFRQAVEMICEANALLARRASPSTPIRAGRDERRRAGCSTDCRH